MISSHGLFPDTLLARRIVEISLACARVDLGYPLVYSLGTRRSGGDRGLGSECSANALPPPRRGGCAGRGLFTSPCRVSASCRRRCRRILPHALLAGGIVEIGLARRLVFLWDPLVPSRIGLVGCDILRVGEHSWRARAAYGASLASTDLLWESLAFWSLTQLALAFAVDGLRVFTFSAAVL